MGLLKFAILGVKLMIDKHGLVVNIAKKHAVDKLITRRGQAHLVT